MCVHMSTQGQGNTMEAISDCSRAKALDPTYYRALTRLASLLLVGGLVTFAHRCATASRLLVGGVGVWGGLLTKLLQGVQSVLAQPSSQAVV